MVQIVTPSGDNSLDDYKQKASYEPGPKNASGDPVGTDLPYFRHCLAYLYANLTNTDKSLVSVSLVCVKRPQLIRLPELIILLFENSLSV